MAGRIPGPIKRRVQRVRDRYDAWRDGLDERQQRLLDAFLFLALFTVLAAPLYLLLETDWNAWPVRQATASVSTGVLQLIGVDATSAGPVITTPRVIVDVSRDSTGWKSVLALSALMAASRNPLRRTVTGIAAGIGVIAAANVVRITTTIYAVAVLGIPYELLHTVLWRWGLTVIVLLAWIAWLTQPWRRYNLFSRSNG